VRELRIALPSLNSAIRVGTPVLRRTPALNAELRRVFLELEELVEQPETRLTLVRLRQLFNQARPLLRHVTPYQTVCNYWNYDWYNIWEHISQSDDVGFLERVYTVGFPPDQGEEGGSPASYTGIQANGLVGAIDNAPLEPGAQHTFDPDNMPIWHDDNLTVAVDSQGRADCHSGQHGYPLGELGVVGQLPSNPALHSSDFPGRIGTTFAGRPQEP
jgi:hypothetical protein